MPDFGCDCRGCDVLRSADRYLECGRRSLCRPCDQQGRLREHETRRPSLRLADRRCRRRIDPGVRHLDERQPRPDDQLQDQDAGQLVPHRHPSSRLLRWRRRPHDRLGHPSLGETPADPAALPENRIDRSDRLRKLGRLRLVDRAGDRGVGPLHRPPRARRHRRTEPDLLRRARRLQPLRRRRQDLGLDLGGIQRLRRQQPLLVHGRLPGRGTRRATRRRTRSPTTGRSTARSPGTPVSRTPSTPSTS